MPRWSEQAKANSAKLKLQMREHAHAEKMAVLKMMAEDPEAKYFIGAALGAATGVIGSMLASAMTGEDQKIVESRSETAYGWLLTLGSPVALTTYLTGVWSGPATTAEGSITQLIQSGGTSFSAFCVSILYFKSIFGEQGLNELI